MARKMRDSGVEWIGEVPEGWEFLRNKWCFSCSKSIVGKASGTTQLLSLTTSGVKCKGKGVIGGKLPESFDTYQEVSQNDLILCLFDMDCSAVFSGLSRFDGMISPAYKVMKCKRCIEPKYADYWFDFVGSQRFFKPYAKNIRYSLTFDEFADLMMIVPPLPEQRRIADYLDEKCAAIDGAVDELKRGIEDCKAWKKAIIFEAVTGKRKIGFNAEKQRGRVAERPMRDSGIPWIGEIPEGWEVRRLKGVLARPLQYGASESGIGYNEALPRYIRITDITLDGKLKGEGALSLTEEAASDYILRDQDILLARSGATVGKAFLYEKQMGRAAFAGYLIRATVDVAKALPRFVYYTTLGCGYDDWRSSIAVSATIQNIGADKYNNYSLPIPPMKEQQAIADYLDEKCAAIDALVAEKEKLIADLETYKKSLIFELVTGKREVA
jgi:type I restriction enzyme S subunit